MTERAVKQKMKVTLSAVKPFSRTRDKPFVPIWFYRQGTVGGCPEAERGR